MPKKSRKAPLKPSRAQALAIEPDESRGPLMRVLLHSPKDVVAAMFATAAVVAIIVNALMMQAGRHPSPMFGGSISPPALPAIAGPLPRPRPVEAAQRNADLFASPTKLTATPPPAATVAAPPTAAPAVASSAAQPRPPAPVPASNRSADPLGDLINSSRRIAAVQRALTEFGYGQLKPTGNVGTDTQAAIQKFERDRKMPVTGQLSDRLVRELAAMTGRPIE
uniref:Peptidoglycan-binding domain 1 protein n=1 Tax=Rhodopseudomonas palustris (strain BisA53) TaxID=316055 RepID=Q07QG3_RHOP5